MANRRAEGANEAPSIPPLASAPGLEQDIKISSLMQDPVASEETASKGPAPTLDGDATLGQRRLWSLEKKRAAEKESMATDAPGAQSLPVAPLRSVSPLRSPERLNARSPKRNVYPYGTASSPSGPGLSPRPHSPASSQIFERSVQDEALPPQASPSIPSHIITENHIPSVLEEASAAITDTKLDPDSVEIVTHSMHQPAALTVTGTPAGEQSMASSVLEEPGQHRETEETSSNLGNAGSVPSFDAPDVRRLSFVSFADVIHAEQAAESSDATNVAASQRSPSPLRSPTSSHGLGTSPPTSVSPPSKTLDSLPGGAGLHLASGSPVPPAQSPPLAVELNVETMRQALRRTGSGDLSSARNGGLGAPAVDDQ